MFCLMDCRPCNSNCLYLHSSGNTTIWKKRIDTVWWKTTIYRPRYVLFLIYRVVKKMKYCGQFLFFFCSNAPRSGFAFVAINSPAVYYIVCVVKSGLFFVDIQELLRMSQRSFHNYIQVQTTQNNNSWVCWFFCVYVIGGVPYYKKKTITWVFGNCLIWGEIFKCIITFPATYVMIKIHTILQFANVYTISSIIIIIKSLVYITEW